MVLTLPGVTGTWSVRQSLLATGSGDVVAAAQALHIGEWPSDQDEWDRLTEATRLPEVESSVTADDGLRLELTLPMPSAILVELVRA